jgi:hypothetical protein
MFRELTKWTRALALGGILSVALCLALPMPLTQAAEQL